MDKDGLYELKYWQKRERGIGGKPLEEKGIEVSRLWLTQTRDTLRTGCRRYEVARLSHNPEGGDRGYLVDGHFVVLPQVTADTPLCRGSPALYPGLIILGESESGIQEFVEDWGFPNFDSNQVVFLGEKVN